MLESRLIRNGWKFERFAGSVRGDTVISRALVLQFDDGDGKYQSYPFRIIIKEGPGETTKTGAITPKGSATDTVDTRVPFETFLESMIELRDWLRERQPRIEQQRWDEQMERYHRKQGRRE
ncbi:MAG: hypothetical protein HC876_18195 [Chloroflexaceae bacterium]|nr:hypothetical protein [Chloroflexaceae bacterium]